MTVVIFSVVSVPTVVATDLLPYRDCFLLVEISPVEGTYSF